MLSALILLPAALRWFSGEALPVGPIVPIPASTSKTEEAAVTAIASTFPARIAA